MSSSFTGSLLKRLVDRSLTPEEAARIEAAVHTNSAGFDEWGLNPHTVQGALALLRWIYRDYFRVETLGIERLPKDGRLLLAANHGGQVPIDGVLIAMSLLLEADPARLARGMVERWVPSVPYVSTFFSRVGQVVGDHRNCRDLLEQDQTVLVFPEGVRGSGKTFFHRYQLQNFGMGFVRLALETRAPIVPIAVIGCEEIFPSVLDLKLVAKMIRAPYFPLMPLFPLPMKVTLRYAEPIYFNEDPDCPDSVVSELVGRVKRAIEEELRQGLEKRGQAVFTRAAK